MVRQIFLSLTTTIIIISTSICLSASPATATTPGFAKSDSPHLFPLPAADGQVQITSMHEKWGPTGNRIVAQIAENHLSETAEKQIFQLLDSAPLASVASRTDRGHDAQYQSREDLITALRKHENILQDPDAPKKEKVTALHMVIKIAGDLHQPLNMHDGHQKTNKKHQNTGNETDVLWFGSKTDLHSVWDNKLIDHTQLSYTEFASFIDRAAGGEIADWQNSTYSDWASESRALVEKATDFSLAENEYRSECQKPGRRCKKSPVKPGRYSALPNLEWTYNDEMLPIVKDRLLKAGVRLAGVLNEIFDEPA